MNPDVSIVVAVTRFDLFYKLIESIENHTRGVMLEVIGVTFLPVEPYVAGSANRFLHRPYIRWVMEERAEGCVKAFNRGFRAAQGQFIVHLNDDCEVQPDWLLNMLSALQGGESLGAFAFLSPHTTGYVVQDFPAGSGRWYANFGCIRRDVMERLGYWDERFAHYGADPDFGMKVWHAGLKVVPVYDAKIYHACVEDQWRREDLRDPASAQLQEKWRGIFL